MATATCDAHLLWRARERAPQPPEVLRARRAAAEQQRRVAEVVAQRRVLRRDASARNLGVDVASPSAAAVAPRWRTCASLQHAAPWYSGQAVRLKSGVAGGTAPGALAQLTLRGVNASPPAGRHSPYSAQYGAPAAARRGAQKASAASAASACDNQRRRQCERRGQSERRTRGRTSAGVRARVIAHRAPARTRREAAGV